MIGALRRAPGAVVGGADHNLPVGKARLLLTVVVLVVALGGAAMVAKLATSTADTIRADDAGPAAMAAVVKLTPQLLDYDYQTIKTDIARAQSVTTGDYWAQNSLAQTLTPAVVQQQASTKTVVESAGVADAQPDRVVVLVFLTQTTTGKTLQAPRVDSRVARVTADLVNGRWLIGEFDPI
ncbi:MAG TPA: hypothetical protein VG756_10935 [Pseudonocardiaceae bacterium]|nr:hypothetical protein [Pseudonocardiaceae bacterium]